MNKALATLALGAVLAVSVPATADAKAGDVKAKGTCSAASSSKIKLSMSNGRIETEFEVDQNRVGKVWNVVIRDNGVVVANTLATTTAPSGSFTVRRLLANRAGSDRVVARATNAATGETCSATATI
jgi:hypothetical protein